MNKIIFLLAGILFITISCKKETQAPPSIYGKWFLANSRSKLYNNSNLLVDSVGRTNFTGDDFVAYNNDGSGYYSSASTPAPSLSTFKFTINGTTLVQTISNENSALIETITTLTASTLSLHAELIVPDPNNPGISDKEVDDIDYHK